MASKSVLIVALLFSVLILCLQGTYADRIEGWEGGHARFYGGGDAPASDAIGKFPSHICFFFFLSVFLHL